MIDTDELTGELWYRWKHDPITIKFHEKMSSLIADIEKEMLSENSVCVDNNHLRRLYGRKEILEDILQLELFDLIEYNEGVDNE